MSGRRHPFGPSAEGVEPRVLLSTVHHPSAYTGTIHGSLEGVAPEPSSGVSLETFAIVKASGTLAPYGSVGVSSGSALDHSVQIGLLSVILPVENRQSVELEIVRHGRDEVGLELDGPVVPSGTSLQAGRYSVVVENPNATERLATRTAILTIPRGLPQHPGQLKPFTITFQTVS